MYPEVRKAMIDRNMTVAQLARETGIPAPTLYAKLSGHGEFKLSELKKIKQALEVADVPIDLLFERRG